MKKISLLLIGLSLCNIFAQKKELYTDDDLNYITKEAFYAPKTKNTYLIRFELATKVINVRALRQKRGVLSKEEHLQLKNELKAISGKVFSDNATIVINYYPGEDSCNSTGNKNIKKRKYRIYNHRIGKKKNVQQFFIYKKIEGTENYGKQLEWYSSKETSIEKTFFPIHYACGSYVIINPNGEYYALRGEYNIDKIIKYIDNPTTFRCHD